MLVNICRHSNFRTVYSIRAFKFRAECCRVIYPITTAQHSANSWCVCLPWWVYIAVEDSAPGRDEEIHHSCEV